MQRCAFSHLQGLFAGIQRDAFCVRCDDEAIFRLHDFVAGLDICTDIPGERTAGDADILQRVRIAAGHRFDHLMIPAGCKGSVVDDELSFVHFIIQLAIQDDGLIRHERSIVDRRLVPVQHRCLRDIRKGSAIDRQLSIIIVFDRIQTAGERTAMDDHVGWFLRGVLISVVPAVFDQAGELAILTDDDTFFDRHISVVDDIIIGISTAGRTVGTIFLTSGIRTALQQSARSQFIINNCPSM